MNFKQRCIVAGAMLLLAALPMFGQSEQVTYSIKSQNIYSSLSTVPGSAYLQMGKFGITSGTLAPCLVRGLTQSGSSLLLEGCNVSGPQQLSDWTVATSTVQGPHAESASSGYSSELITLSTVSVTSTSVGSLLPANSFIKSVVCDVTTTITGAANWKIGDGTTTGRFNPASSLLTAGSQIVGLTHRSPTLTTDATGAIQVTAAALVITTNANATAGAVRCTTFWEKYTAPTG